MLSRPSLGSLFGHRSQNQSLPITVRFYELDAPLKLADVILWATFTAYSTWTQSLHEKTSSTAILPFKERRIHLADRSCRSFSVQHQVQQNVPSKTSRSGSCLVSFASTKRCFTQVLTRVVDDLQQGRGERLMQTRGGGEKVRNRSIYPLKTKSLTTSF
jgi:hypothetical protein